MRTRVRLDGPPQEGTRFATERLVCEVLGVELGAARRLLAEFPALLPIAQDEAAARELEGKFAELGVGVSIVVIPDGATKHCAFHPSFFEASRCTNCGRVLCLICGRQPNGICTLCQQKISRRRRNQRIRVGVLLTVLFGVCMLGVKEWRRRNVGWERSHRIAVILVQNAGAPLSTDLAAAFAQRADAVERALSVQRQRYSPTADAPVELTVVGPVSEATVPPSLESTGLLDLLTFNLALGRYAEQHDEIAGVDGSSFDVRLYVRVQQADDSREMAEGLGQQQGRIGVVTTAISPSGIDFAWFVVIHEYLHTRGATDKYGVDGRASIPEGLAEPNLVPLYPQPGTELMARGRPLSPTEEDLPGAPSTWVVGKWTATEIHW